jgi:uncharacterized protein (DUF1330 family)
VLITPARLELVRWMKSHEFSERKALRVVATSANAIRSLLARRDVLLNHAPCHLLAPYFMRSSQILTGKTAPMKTNLKLTVSLLFGVSTGLAVAQVIHAQQAKAGPAYIIAEVEKDPTKPQDPAALRKYSEETPKSLAAFGARYLVHGVNAQTLEGEVSKGRIVVIAFDSIEKARGWYYSPAYEALKPIRQASTKSRLLLVEGGSDQ